MHLLTVDEKGIKYDDFIKLDDYTREKIEIAQRQVMTSFTQKKITESWAKSLLGMISDKVNTWDGAFDHFEQVFKDFIHALVNHEYYLILERIEKGEKMLAEETDKGKKVLYRAGLKKLEIELESYRPKEETA